MKRILIICVFLLTFSVSAETDLKKYNFPNNRVITITGHPDYPPVIWFNEEAKEFRGIGVELLQMILKEINVKANFINVETWARAQQEVKNGRIDILLPPYKTPEREIIYNYNTAPFMMDATVVFTKKDKQFKFETFEDLLKYPGVAIIKDSFGVDFDKFEQKHKMLTRLPTTEQCFRFVDKDRARFIVAGINSGMTALAKLNWESKYTYLPKNIIMAGMYAPVSMKSPWNTPAFNDFLKKKFTEYTRQGVVKKLEIKYLEILKKENANAKRSLNKSAKPGNSTT